MLVRAVRFGYAYDQKRRPGDVFELKDPSHFSDAHRKGRPGWMEKVEEDPPAKPSKKAKQAAPAPSVNDDVI